MCNCKANDLILGIVILVFAFWQTMYSKWIIVIAAVLLIIHSLGCKDMCATGASAMPKVKAKKKKANTRKGTRKKKR